MTVTISRNCGSARRAYRIECPDDARLDPDPAEGHATIVIPGPQHREHPERSVWLRLDDALDAAREGRYGLRLVAEESLIAPAAEVSIATTLRVDTKPRKPSRRHALVLAAIGLLAWAAGSAQVVAGAPGDPRFPATIAAEVGGKPARLLLTGSAERTKLRFRVYGVGSYAQAGVAIPDAETLAALDIPKQLHLIFERDVDGATMAKAFRESIGRSYPAPAFAAELATLERYFAANPAREGDHIRLTHVPGVGMEVRVNAQPGMLIRGVGFSRAAWGTYLGPNNLGLALKEGLTSRLR